MDLVGKEFVSVEFEGGDKLICDSIYKETFGEIGIIQGFNSDYPQYVLVKFVNINGNCKGIKLHWPVEVVKKQLETKEELLSNPEYINSLFKLIKKTCQNIK